MSFWLYRKERGGRRSLYLLDWDLGLPLIGIVIMLVVLVLRLLGLMP
jgi:hypothetical protein